MWKLSPNTFPKTFQCTKHVWFFFFLDFIWFHVFWLFRYNIHKTNTILNLNLPKHITPDFAKKMSRLVVVKTVFH